MKSPLTGGFRWLSVAGAGVLGLGLLAWYGSAGPEATEAVETAAALAPAQERPLVTLYKNPSCACCADWAEHLEENGFAVHIREEGFDLHAIKDRYGVTPRLASCHTAVVADYVIEGHVPADVIVQLLAERPQIRGLAVPGMPPGVPGMPDPGPIRDPYDILAIEADGAVHTYATR